MRLFLFAMMSLVSTASFAAKNMDCQFRSQDRDLPTSIKAPQTLSIFNTGLNWHLLENGKEVQTDFVVPEENRINLTKTYFVGSLVVQNSYDIAFDTCKSELKIASIGEVNPPGYENSEFPTVTVQFDCSCTK